MQPRLYIHRFRGSPASDPQPIFSINAAPCTDPLGTELGLCPSHIVLDGNSAPLPLKGAQQTIHFFAHVYCGQTAGWIKMPFGRELGLGPCHIVLDGDPAPPRKGAQHPRLFGPCLFWINGPQSH